MGRTRNSGGWRRRLVQFGHRIGFDAGIGVLMLLLVVFGGTRLLEHESTDTAVTPAPIDPVATAIARAELLLGTGDIDGCEKLLAEPPLEPLPAPAALDRNLGERLRLLRARAVFHRRARAVMRAAGDDALPAIEKFLGQYPVAPTASETAGIELLKVRRRELAAELRLAAVREAADMGALLDAAVGAARHPDLSTDERTTVRVIVETWVSQDGFPPLVPPRALAGLQEAATGDGARLFGLFEYDRFNDRWYYWSGESAQGDSPLGERRFTAEALSATPAEPVYLRWVAAYNVGANRLLADLDAAEEWRSFADECQALSAESVDYAARWGQTEAFDATCQAWDFAGSAQRAATVVGRWEDWEQIRSLDAQ
jgi:hypothetical protein